MKNLASALVHQIMVGDVLLSAVLIVLATSIVCRVLFLLSIVTRGGLVDRYGRLGWQIGALLGLEQAYEFTRGQIPQRTDVALFHAYGLLDLEWRHGMFIEQRLEQYFLHFKTMMAAIDIFYVAGHVAVTIGVLIWIGLKHKGEYPHLRNMLILTTGIALIAFYFYPTAPPRLLGQYGFQDPLVMNHLIPAGEAEPGSYTFNPYAAMPSLHVAYALVACWCLYSVQRQIAVRVLALLYPVAMAAAVLISGNHWVLDVVGAVVTVLAARTIIFALVILQSVVPLYLGRMVPNRRPT
ncbi:MAG: phosphatase PAP2 family protein [Chloroflexota bacterium]